MSGTRGESSLGRPSPDPSGSGEGYVGRSVFRIEDVPLLTGRAMFADDYDRPGQLYARVVRSAVPHARLLGVDTSAALAVPGVVAVVTGVDVPDVRIPIRVAPTPAAERALQAPMATDRIRYVGEPVAVVVASNPYVAEDAAELVTYETEALPALLDPADAAGAVPALHDSVPDNVADVARVRKGGSVDEVFAEAAVVERERLGIHRHTAAPLETRGLLADPDHDGRLTVWGPAKVKHFNRQILANMIGREVDSIRFIEPSVGGGFGPRGEFYPEDFLIPWLAVSLGKPVKWIEDRQENFIAQNHSREQVAELELAAAEDGRFLAFRARIWVGLGAYTRTHGMVLATNTLSHLAGPYEWEAFEAEALGVLTNKTPAGTYRGPGQFEPAFLRERMVDRLAARLGIEPSELRRRNLIEVGRLPYEVEMGDDATVVYDTGDFELLFDRLLDDAGYEELRAATAKRRERGELVGVGTAAFVEAGAIGSEEWARIEPLANGKFRVHVGIASVGQGIATTLSQIAADALSVDIGRIEISHSDTDEVPDGRGAFSSRSVIFGGSAIKGAADDLIARARDAAADELEIDPGDLVVHDGEVRVLGGGSRALAFADLGCEGRFHFSKSARTFSMGAALAQVVIDRETFAPTIERCVVACDVGRAINPQIVRGQVVGAAAQGIGGALLEELAYGEDGQPLATSFMDYLMPTAVEVPDTEPIVLELPQHRPESANPLGVKGAGEAGIVGIGAAIANAAAQAIGDARAVSSLPLTPEKLRSARRRA